MTAPRWWEPRFEGAVVSERVLPGFLDVLADRARRLGLRVVEEPADSHPSYRESAAPARALRIEHAEAFVGAWDRLRIWQDGGGTVRYEGSFSRWRAHLLVTWLVFAGVYAAVLSFCCTSWIGWAMGSWLFLWFVPLYLRHRRRTCAWVERLILDELHTARRAAAGPISTAPAHETPSPAPARAAARTRVEPRLRVDDAALAVTARSARHRVSERPDRAPEDEVASIEKEFARRR